MGSAICLATGPDMGLRVRAVQSVQRLASGDSGSNSGRSNDFSLLQNIKISSGPTQPPIQQYQRLFFPDGKAARREAANCPTPSDEVKTEWLHTFTPP